MTANPFLDAYIDAALWSSTDEDGEPLDSSYDRDDLDAGTLAQMRADCTAFELEHADDLALAGDASQNGHDFWLLKAEQLAGEHAIDSIYNRGVGVC